MKYNLGNSVYTIPDEEIDKLVDALEISIDEACELWLSDNGEIENEEQDTLDKEAKKGGRRYEKSDKPRKKTTKERKVDENKAEILDLIRKAFDNHEDIDITGQKTETELYLEYENEKYTIKLTKHRPKK